MAKKAVEEIFVLFNKFGSGDYLGEPISKTVHSIQCGMLAEKENAAVPVILGSFFHDIGHMVGVSEGKKEMIFEGQNLGISNHGAVGAEYLETKGFSKEVTDIVRAHVLAKKYLCFKDKDYYEKLSWASARTLEIQGGPMTETQAKDFENQPGFKTFIRMRAWDEAAKDPNWTNLQDLSHFKQMSLAYLNSFPVKH